MGFKIKSNNNWSEDDSESDSEENKNEPVETEDVNVSMGHGWNSAFTEIYGFSKVFNELVNA